MAADPFMRHYFAPLLEPQSVAIVGASERKGSVGSEVPRRVDLAVIETPAATVPGIIEQCGAAGVRAAEVGVTRYITNPDGSSCEFAIVVDDEWQKHGLGRYLMSQLIGIARSRGLATMSGDILTANQPMLALERR